MYYTLVSNHLKCNGFMILYPLINIISMFIYDSCLILLFSVLQLMVLLLQRKSPT